MIQHGFAAVRASLANMERLHSRSPLARLAAKTWFHLADLIPPEADGPASGLRLILER
jgi:hypothetical protein